MSHRTAILGNHAEIIEDVHVNKMFSHTGATMCSSTLPRTQVSRILY